MGLGIRPLIDFVFKKIFGSPENSAALIGLLNAILKLAKPIVAVEILNPFSYQEFADAKQIVLDVRCRDSEGRLLNVELQIAAYPGLIERLVFYAASMYVDQLNAGQNYTSVGPAISICLLNHVLFRDTQQAHHHFRMMDLESGRKLEKAIEVQTVELPKYNLDEATITRASKLEQWVFLLLYAQDYDAETLRRLLLGIEFEEAIRTIEIISQKTEDKQMYDQREKAQRDYEWAISGAREQGKAEGHKEGHKEGCEVGKLAGTIQTLQMLLGDAIATDAELLSCDLKSLELQVAKLQQRLRDRRV